MDSKTVIPTVKQIEHAILSYLLEHPRADDTVEGIVEWWLLRQEVQRQTVTVKEALRNLVRKEFVLAVRKKDGRLHYRLNPSQRKEVHPAIGTGPPTEKE
jgi:predicted transcriptional regulator